jgi:hypothetical protein
MLGMRLIIASLIISLIILNILTINNKVFARIVYAQENQHYKSILPFIGVAMRGYYTSLAQLQHFKTLPANYYEDSFRLISQAGMNHVRYLLYWEGYEKNPSLFLRELTTVANTADKWGIKVVYDNHQWHTSSWLEPNSGTGFPSFLFENNHKYKQGGGGNTNDKSAKIWWTDWWNRSIKDTNGTDGWTLQANFLKKIVNAVDRNPSTLGYEILSEPHVDSIDEWDKVGKFNTFMTDELRKVTQKIIAYSQQVPASINAPKIKVTPENQAKMVPANKTNVVFKISLYGVPTDPYHGARLAVLSKAGKLAGVPLYVGEWNNVEREKSEGVFKINPKKSDITQSEVNLFVQSFKKLKVWGWSYWQWNFKINKSPNFNLIEVNGNGTLQPTKYYEQLKNAIFNSYR